MPERCRHDMNDGFKTAPLLLLLLALSTVFLFGNDRGQFYRNGHHDSVSVNHLTDGSFIKLWEGEVRLSE